MHTGHQELDSYLDGIAVAGNVVVVLGPVPVLAQDVIHEIRAGACWCPVESVVRAHKAAHLGVSGALLERREVVLGQVLQGNNGVEPVSYDALPSFQVVGRVVFASCNDLPNGTIPFEALEQCFHIALDADGIFAWGLREIREYMGNTTFRQLTLLPHGPFPIAGLCMG